MKIRSKLILSAVAATLGCALLAGCGGEENNIFENIQLQNSN